MGTTTRKCDGCGEPIIPKKYKSFLGKLFCVSCFIQGKHKDLLKNRNN
jgi:formylmethanofuran dehydrogenase subunit E